MANTALANANRTFRCSRTGPIDGPVLRGSGSTAVHRESGCVGGDTPGGFGPPPRCARTPPPSAFSRTGAERTAPAAVAHVLELNLDAVGRVEQDLGVPSPAVAAQELVTHGQIRVQDRANLRRARGVE